MKNLRWLTVFSLTLGAIFVCLSPLSLAADQTVPGQGNTAASQLSLASPLVQSAFTMLHERLETVHADLLRNSIKELLDDTHACILHRANLSVADRTQIVAKLINEGLLDANDGNAIPGGIEAGIFPAVLQDGSSCPKMPQPFYAAPGGATGGHHDHPGGLALHEAFNDTNALGLANSYRTVYGHSNKNGLPVVALDRLTKRTSKKSRLKPDFNIDHDIVLIAPIWHDWAKTIVFQWYSDGTEFTELNFGGNGLTDNSGSAGNSKTGAHHILGLAEAMKRGLPADFVITVASAHSVPTSGNEYKVVNWLRTAAIIAQIDPVVAGYLSTDLKGQLRLPALRHLGDIDLNAAPITQTNMLIEYILHNLSDADFAFTGPAAADVGLIIAKLAPEFGYDPTTADFLVSFRHPVLTYLSAERLYILYSNGGLDAVRKEISKLRKIAVL